MNTLTMDDALKAVRGLPSLPAVVVDLLASLEQANIDIASLARKLALDQALAAKTLRLANSPFYGLPRQVATISEAISVFGLQNIRNLALTGAIFDGLSRERGGPLGFADFWRHTIGTAHCAQALAAQLGVNRGQAYIAGLLHDVGRLALATWFPAKYAAVLAVRHERDCLFYEAEQSVLGLDHMAVGAALARHWKFPDAMVQAIALHHGAQDEGVPPLALLVQAADAIAHALGFSKDEDDLVPAIAEIVWRRLGLDDKMLMDTFRDAERQFEAACGVLAD